MNNVSMFIPCLVDLLLPEVGEAMFHLLLKLGKSPVYHKEQTCCGQPAVNSGYRSHAITAAKHFIQVFENDDIIVCPSGSCVSLVKYDYPEILKEEPEWRKRSQRVGSKIYEFSQYLVDVLKIESIGATFDGKIAYHESCQNLRKLRVVDQPKILLSAVIDVQLVKMNGASNCCGFGGEFSLNYPSISAAMLKEKTDNFIACDAEVLVISEPGCLINVNGYLSRHHPDKKAVHLIQFLAENIS